MKKSELKQPRRDEEHEEKIGEAAFSQGPDACSFKGPDEAS
jgi:hypothetical protein